MCYAHGGAFMMLAPGVVPCLGIYPTAKTGDHIHMGLAMTMPSADSNQRTPPHRLAPAHLYPRSHAGRWAARLGGPLRPLLTEKPQSSDRKVFCRRRVIYHKLFSPLRIKCHKSGSTAPAVRSRAFFFFHSISFKQWLMMYQNCNWQGHQFLM